MMKTKKATRFDSPDKLKKRLKALAVQRHKILEAQRRASVALMKDIDFAEGKRLVKSLDEINAQFGEVEREMDTIHDQLDQLKEMTKARNPRQNASAKKTATKTKNPRYLVTGINASGHEAELGILSQQNKMLAVQRAKTLYPQYKKLTATLVDKQDYIGGRTAISEAEKKAIARKKAAAKKTATKTKNPRYLVTGINASGHEAELGILSQQNKMLAVQRAKKLYPGHTKLTATLVDKQDHIGGRTTISEAEKKAIARKKAAAKKTATKTKNPRYLMKGTVTTKRESELGILSQPTKRLATQQARKLYPGTTKLSATLVDKKDHIGGRTKISEAEKEAVAKRAKREKAAKKANPLRLRNSAGELYETFTGLPHTGHQTVTAPTGAPRNLDELGDFVEFKWMDADGKCFTVNLEEQGICAKLAGHQYADGRFELVLVSAPGQPLPYFGDYLPHGNHGHIYEVTYRAQKAHLSDAKARLYYHKLGEETGAPPIFHINREGELLFKGGEYWITERGIHN